LAHAAISKAKNAFRRLLHIGVESFLNDAPGVLFVVLIHVNLFAWFNDG
jgi:hypothetical protein